MDFSKAFQLLLRVETLKYLDRYGFLKSVRANRATFRKSLLERSCPVFDLTVDVDPYRLADDSGNLADLLMEEPQIALGIFREVIVVALRVILDHDTIVSEQVEVSLRTSSLPTTGPVRRIAAMHSEGLVSIRAVLCDHSGSRKKTRTAVWTCSSGCGETVTTTKYLPSKAPTCRTCCRDLRELKSERDTVECFTGRFVDETALSDPDVGTRYRSIHVEIPGKLVDTLDLGASYVVTGCFDTRGVMHAWNVRRSNSERIGSLSDVPSTIDAVRSVLGYSPYRFVHVLATQLGAELYPASTFVHLKYGLLLSLASVESNPENAPIPILAAGVDTLSADRLMVLVSKLAPRRVVFSSTNAMNLTGSRNRDGWYESGALCLADSGVCYVGDWEKFVQGQTGFVLRSVIESTTIPVDPVTGYCVPLRAAVWSHWQFRTANRTKNLSKLKTILDLFGFPFLSDADDESELIESVLRGRGEPKRGAFESSDTRTFLRIVNARPVRICLEAQDTIKDYFVASRKCRPGVLPIGVVKTSISLAESHAKLAFREEASPCDALIAVYLCELTVQALFGTDSTKPVPALPSDDSKIDETMIEFEEWFRDYCRSAGISRSDKRWVERIPSPSV